MKSSANSNSTPIPHRASLADNSKNSRDYVNRLIGLTLSKYFSTVILLINIGYLSRKT